MTDILHLDWETRSDVNLTKVGLDRYTSPESDPRVLMGSYAINPTRQNMNLRHWEAHRKPMPAELREAIEDPEVEKWCFGAQFERVVATKVLGLRTSRKGWRCSMVLAYMQSFTGGLKEVGEQIGLPLDMQKLTTGDKLIKTFTMPQRITKKNPHLWRDWKTDPDLWDDFCDYNIQDTATEIGVKTRLIKYPVPPIEWEFYELDQLVNDRGIPIDMDFVENLIVMAARRKAELLGEMRALTGLANPNSHDQVLPWLQQHGYPYDDLQKANVQKALNRSSDLFGCEKETPDEQAPGVVRVLRRRQWASKTSIGKADTAKEVVGDDGRARYLFQFAGAQRTNRFSGRLIQTQNMERTPKIFDAEESDAKLSFVTDLIRTGRYEAFDDLFIDEPMRAFSGCMRGMLRAEDGDEFVTADLKSIESAVIAWVTNCERLLNVFRTGRDPYLDFGQDFYRKPYDKITRAERQVVKPPCLGCGFRLSAGKEEDGVKTGLLKYAEDMGVDLTLAEAKHAVKTFRSVYPEIEAHWYAYEKAVRLCLKTGQPQVVGPVTFIWDKPYMRILLPSGRSIYYYKPRIEKRLIYTGKTVKRREAMPAEFARYPGEMQEIDEPEFYVRRVFTYMGRNQKNSQWTRLEGHGGVIIENLVQGIARDILRECGMALHKLGFNLISHAHDEWMALIRKGDNYFTLERMIEVFKQDIAWAPGLPLGAAGWQAKFYRK